MRYQIESSSRQERKNESKIRLPVVVAKSGTTYVIEPKGRDAAVFEGNTDFRWSGVDNKKGTARGSEVIRIYLRYPEVPAAAARAAIKQIEQEADEKRIVQININAGPAGIEWEGIQKFAEEALGGCDRGKIAVGIAIEGQYSRPAEKHKDWLARNRIAARYVFGRALGYKGEIDAEAEGVLRAMSDYGLRVPVLYYWAGERKEVVAEELKKALRFNKTSGIGIMPYYFSPRFNDYANIPAERLRNFGDVIEYLLEERILGEHLDEPVSDIEGRLAGNGNLQGLRYSLKADGTMQTFRMFAFASSERREITMCGRCRRCAWRHICGGIDAAPPDNRRQYKIIAEAWCGFRETIIRRVIRECLEIREFLHKHKGEMAEAAS